MPRAVSGTLSTPGPLMLSSSVPLVTSACSGCPGRRPGRPTSMEVSPSVPPPMPPHTVSRGYRRASCGREQARASQAVRQLQSVSKGCPVTNAAPASQQPVATHTPPHLCKHAVHV